MSIDAVEGFRKYAITHAQTISDQHFAANRPRFPGGAPGGGEIPPDELSSMHCAHCGGPRRMGVTVNSIPSGFPDGRPVAPPVLGNPGSYGSNPLPDRMKQIAPSLFTLRCSQCDDRFTLLAYKASTGSEAVIVLPQQQRGAATPHTPANVGYYIEQAEQSRSVGARSAAVSMYRSAVEMLLYEQRYTEGMLNAKIQKLEADQERGLGPIWVKDVSANALKVLKDLGNAAIHPNDGDISRQDKLDSDLLINVENVVQGLCRLVYEAPLELEETMSLLNDRARAMTEKPAGPESPSHG